MAQIDSSIATKEEMRQEALERMKALNLPEDIIQEFREKGTIKCSDSFQFRDLSPQEKKEVEEAEQNFGLLVFHTAYTPTVYPDMIAFFCVSPYKEDDWAMERKLLHDSKPYVFVYNLGEPLYSELGCIDIRQRPNGVIVRTA